MKKLISHRSLRSLSFVFCALSLAAFAAREASAEVVINPSSNFGQFESYGMYFDPQSNIYGRSGGNAWGALGGNIAVVGLPNLKYPAQIVMHGSANVSFRMAKSHGQLETKTETIDARVGLAYDMQYSKTWRGAVIWTHESGHISDDVSDTWLIGPDVGNETLDFRVIHDIGRRWRFGGGIKPYFKSHPQMKFLWAEQFAEWYPEDVSPNPQTVRPYMALGLLEGGVDHMDVTVNAQIGLAAADHFSPGHTEGLRALIGYYNGIDPRMKYLQYMHETQNFLYAGLAFDL